MKSLYSQDLWSQTELNLEISSSASIPSAFAFILANSSFAASTPAASTFSLTSLSFTAALEDEVDASPVLVLSL